MGWQPHATATISSLDLNLLVLLVAVINPLLRNTSKGTKMDQGSNGALQELQHFLEGNTNRTRSRNKQAGYMLHGHDCQRS